MTNIISFEYDTTLTNELFLEKVQKDFVQIFQEKWVSKIYLDLTNVKFIAPTVLPKLCCMGVIAKRNGIEVEVVVEPNSKVKYYLSQANFFDIVNRYDILTVDEGLIGGEIESNKLTYAFLCFDKEKLIKKYERLYEFSKEVSEKDKLMFCVKTEIIGQTYQTDRLDREIIRKSPTLSVLEKLCDNIDTVNEIAMAFAELIHNALWHGMTLCFFCLQLGTYSDKYNNKNVRVDVSVMDCGMGLYDSLHKKDWIKEMKTTKTIEKKKFLQLKQRKAKDFYSVVEMVLYRKDDEIRGMYQLLKGLLGKKKLEILFINRSMKLVADEIVVKKILDEDIQLKDSVEWIDDIGIGFGMDISFYA